MRNWKSSLVVVAAATAASFTAANAEVSIATVGPMTGQYASFGEQMKRGAEMAVKDLNAKGGVLGQKVKLIIGDDACDPKQAVAVANKLVSQKVAFVAGHFCSGSSIPASAVYAENGVLQISPASTNPALTEAAAKKGWINVFRVCGRDDAQGIVAGRFLASAFKGKKIAILHDKTAYGKGLADETRKNLRAAGGKEAMYEAYTAGEKDYSALISKMKAAGIAAFYVGGYHTEAGLMIRQAHEQGYKPQLISGDALVTDEYWKITGPAGEGTLMTFQPDPRKKAQAKAVVARFLKDKYDPEGYTLYTYAAIQVWAEATKRAKSLKMKALSKVLRGGTYETVIGKLNFDNKGDVKDPEYVWYVWKNGKYAEK
ncbi:MAG: branched-chain amino acid ABC transporter substrate-binding protein [Alphaproteobacteria bacterium]|nr:branched-chain amino acid ABC transporter substrate-binding protein [Alphaproteobacteria bacterium]